MRMYDIIAAKRDGRELTDAELDFFIRGYTAGEIPEEQASALAMAIYFRGMSARETSVLTDRMAHSGDCTDLSAFGDTTVDKHSTGGVGDKTTLIVAPIAAALGATVAKISGRGLGSTGGTVDKLESIPGFCTELSSEAFFRQLKQIGLCVTGQSGNMVPADKKLYALRDSTATVESLPLIASSIMCKKLASGAHSIVLDVKTGSGAFMKTSADAERLAQMMVNIGSAAGRRMCALVTDMDEPLGNAVGNALEVQEALRVLHGEISDGALYRLCVRLASKMVSLAFGWEDAVSLEKVQKVITTGAALEKMEEMVAAQGGDPAYVRDLSKFRVAKYQRELVADGDGILFSTDAAEIGNACMLLGAGRAKKNDRIDPTAGILLDIHCGAKLKRGDRIATLYASDPALFPEAERVFRSALTFSDRMLEPHPLIYREISEPAENG